MFFEMTDVKTLLAAQRELQSKMADSQDNAEEFAQYEREYKANAREIEILNAEATAKANAPKREVNKNEQFLKVIREAKRGGQTDFTLQREVTSSVVTSGDVNNIETAGMPVTIKDVLPPLEMGTVYDKMGIQIATGIHGTLIWPALDTVATCSIAGETVELDDTDLDFSKITASPQRVGISIAVTNEALNDASFDLQGLVLNQVRAALARVINNAVVGGTAVGTLSGPFAGTLTNRNSVTFASTYPTYAELLSMKGAVANDGVQMKAFGYVMSAVTYATLEATPITEGDSRMIIENGKIAGYPVFVTNSTNIADGTVYAGDFAYAALAQHGDIHLIIDPYTAAKNNEVVFTLNCNLSLSVLRAEAFCVGASA